MHEKHIRNETLWTSNFVYLALFSQKKQQLAINQYH